MKKRRRAGKKASKKSSSKDYKKLFAFLAVFFTIIGFIAVILAKRKDKYVMFYAKQGLVLFFGQVIIIIMSAIPVFGWVLSPFLWIAWFIIWIIAWVNSLSGKMKETPIISHFSKKIRL